MWGSRHSRSAAQLILVLAFAAGCGSSSTTSETLADYAAGNWTCKMTASVASLGGVQPVAIGATAVVTAASATNGRVDITLSGLPSIAPSPDKIGGQWALRSGQLVVKWDDQTQGTMQAEPIALDTTKFKTRSGVAADHPRWSTVTVHRQSRSVSFEFNMVPGVTSPAQLTCRKA